MSWGQRVADQIGASFKILGNQAYLVALNEGISSSGKPLTPIAAVYGDNLISCTISPIISRPKFKDVEISYFDVKKGEYVKVKAPTGIDDVDTAMRTVISAADEDQARNMAASAGKSFDREKGAGSVTILGDVTAEPEAICTVAGVRPGIDGSYRVSSVKHKYKRAASPPTWIFASRRAAQASTNDKYFGRDQSIVHPNNIEISKGKRGNLSAFLF